MAGVPELDGPSSTSANITDGTYDVDAQHADKLGLSRARLPRGVFGPHPFSTPKYSLNLGEQREDFRETMARLFIQVNKLELKTANRKDSTAPFLSSVGADGGDRSREIAQVIAGTTLGGSRSIGNGTGGAGYIDFLLQNVTHTIREKVDVAEMLSDNYVAYYFGQAAPVFTYSGTLINSKQDDQAMNMLRIYRDMARGSQLAKRRKVLSISYDGLVVRGTMNDFTWSLNSDNEMLCPFNFSLLVKKILILPNSNAGLTIVDVKDGLTSSDPSLDSLKNELNNEVVQTNVRRVQLLAIPKVYVHSASTTQKLNGDVT